MHSSIDDNGLDPIPQSVLDSIQDFDENRFRYAMEASGIGAWDLDLVHNTSWRSLRHDQIFGYEEALEN